jgi:hypothetical protein
LPLVAPFDPPAVIKTLDRWLAQNFYWTQREYQYFNIKPRILIEPFLDDGQPDGPLDYRFWCFGGTVEMVQVDNHSHAINPFYTPDWKPLDVHTRDRFKAFDAERPANLGEMLRIATLLSSGFDFVRVDLYNTKEGLRFGEMTFTPGGGAFAFKPAEWERRLGEKWNFDYASLGQRRHVRDVIHGGLAELSRRIAVSTPARNDLR